MSESTSISKMRTAWSSSGSLVSDRIHPHSKQQQQNKGKGKGKGKGKATTPEPPKSKVVRTLEVQLDGARRSSGQVKDPKGGCFCQARKHALSSYTPICQQCGLILCTFNLPYHACPYCASALSDRQGREALVRRLEGELAEQVAREEAEQQKTIEDARAAEGAFPMLPGLQMQTQMRTSHTPPPPPTTRTVLSLNSETKKVTVSSYNTSTAMQSRPASRGEDREEEEGRVPGPPGGVRYTKEPLDPGRPWKSMRIGDVKYVPLSGGTTGDTSKQGRRRRGGERGTTVAARTDG